MIKINKNRKQAGLLALGALAATPISANADTVSANIVAPKDTTYTLGIGELELGSAHATGIPSSATDAKITNNASEVLSVSNGVLHAKPGIYTITYTLTYTDNGQKVTKTADQKITILANPNSSSAGSSIASSASNTSSANVGSSIASDAGSNASTGSSMASNVSSNVSNVTSKASSSSSNTSNSVSTEEAKTVIIKPDAFLTDYLNEAKTQGLTGKIDVKITSGIVTQNGENVTKATVTPDGIVTVDNALESSLAGTMTITLSNGDVLISQLRSGQMTTTLESGPNILDNQSSQNTDGQPDQNTDDQSNQNTDDQPDQNTDGQLDQNTDDLSSQNTDGQLDQNTDDLSSQNTDGQLDQNTNGQSSQNTDGQLDQNTNGQLDQNTNGQPSQNGNNKNVSNGNSGNGAVEPASTNGQASLPQTGESNIETLIGLGILSGMSLTGLALELRKRKHAKRE